MGRSERIASERNKDLSTEMGEARASQLLGSKFEFLFEDAKRRHNCQQRMKEIVADTECTFHPNIQQSQAQRTSVSSRHAGNSSFLGGKSRSVAPETAEVDPSTGQAFFRPKVGRAPKNDRNLACLPIGDYLYAQNKRKGEKIEKKREEEVTRAKQGCNSSYVREESKRIVEGKKTETFTEIFYLLDNDADGIISAKSVNISGTFLASPGDISLAGRGAGTVHAALLRDGRTEPGAQPGRIHRRLGPALRFVESA